ncbi:MAG: DNA translocase FtsK 4TM domain-containing protein [Bacteroidia bacterium]
MDREVLWVRGKVFLGLVGSYLLLAMVAYIIHYDEDRLILEGEVGGQVLENPTGWLGALVAHFLIEKGFGIAAFLLPFYLLFHLYKLIRPNIKWHWSFGQFFFLWYALSVTLGWFVWVAQARSLLWAGKVGSWLAEKLITYIGAFGTLIVLGLLWAWWGGGLRWVMRYAVRRKVSLPSSEPEPLAEEPSEVPPTIIIKRRAPAQEVSEEAPNAPAPTLATQEPPPTMPTSDNEVSEQVTTPQASVIAAHSPPTPVARWLKFRVHVPEEASRADSVPFELIRYLDVPPDRGKHVISAEELAFQKEKIVQTLKEFRIEVETIQATVGPTVTLFEIVPAPGVRISQIKNLEDDLALRLSARGARIIAPLPGKGTVGIEVPHSQPQIVHLRSLLESRAFLESQAMLPLPIGKTVMGEVYVTDLAAMPHLLIAGATGQGKSVFLNCLLTALICRFPPSEIKFVLIDPKKVEMTPYQRLQATYLAQVEGLEETIVTDVKDAADVLASVVAEMEYRYTLLKNVGVRNLSEYNLRYRQGRLGEGEPFLPYLIVVIDELADLMMTAGKEVEMPICRLAQLARAVGIHLIVATQRPSVNVITGLIKANFPTRVSFRVTAKVDSRTILDANGAEQLVGRGDMLFSMGTELLRLQSGYISTEELERFLSGVCQVYAEGSPYHLPLPPKSSDASSEEDFSERDPLFKEAARIIIRSGQGSTSLLQRKLGIGFARAGRLMDQLEQAGIVGPARGAKAREVLIHDESMIS